MYAKNSKNVWVFVLILLAGVILGGFVGELMSSLADAVDFLSFLKVLNYNEHFGLSQPFTLDLGVISLSFGFIIRFSIWGLIGMAAAILIYRKI